MFSKYRSRVQGRSRQVLLGVVIPTAVIAVLASLPTGPLGSAVEHKRDEVARKVRLLDNARKHAADNQALARTGLVRGSGDSRVAIDKVFARIGIQATTGTAANGDGQTSIVIANASFDDVVRAIDAVAHEEGLHLADGSITRLVEPGRVRADLVFAR